MKIEALSEQIRAYCCGHPHLKRVTVSAGPADPLNHLTIESCQISSAVCSTIDCVLAHTHTAELDIQLAEKAGQLNILLTITCNEDQLHHLSFLANRLTHTQNLYACQTDLQACGYCIAPIELSFHGLTLSLTPVSNSSSTTLATVTSCKKPIPHAYDFSPYRLLMVEDNMVNQQLNMALLDETGVEYAAVENGLQAVEAIQQGQVFDVILMDTQMPVMDGLEATRQIRQHPAGKHIPIIALTANALDDDIAKCVKAGMNDHVSKPIHAEVLFMTLERWFEDSKPCDTNQRNIEEYEWEEDATDLSLDSTAVAPSQTQSSRLQPNIDFNSIQFIAPTPQEFDQLLQEFITLYGHIKNIQSITPEQAEVLCDSLNELDLCLAHPPLQHQINFTLENSRSVSPEDLLQSLKQLIHACEAALDKKHHPDKSSPATFHIKIEGFDCDAAIRRMANKPDRYLQVLTLFVKNNEHTAAELETCIHQEDWEQAQRTAHSMKGLAATIGASKLQQVAQDLEHSLKGATSPDNASNEYLKSKIPHLGSLFREESEAVLSTLKVFLNSNK